jgi:hypothetical protein
MPKSPHGPPACIAPGASAGEREKLREDREERLLKIGKSLDDHQTMAVAWLPSSYDRLFRAFDIAWPRLLPAVAERGLPNDTARRRLADVVLLFEGDNRSAAEIAEAALQELGI